MEEEEHTTSLLDNPGSVSTNSTLNNGNYGGANRKANKKSFTYKELQDMRAKEAEEYRAMQRYCVRIKVISLFFVIFSIFLLLNSAIGLSSAPFYDSKTTCNRYETVDDCSKLRTFSTAL